jgi:uncharacterized iron-regulated protein
MRPFAALCAVAALASCAAPGSAPVEDVLDLRMERTVDFDAMVEDLATVPMVYIGEFHSHPEVQSFQLRVVDALSRRNPGLLVGMEMFQRPYQAVLDRWSAGELDEDAFLREVDWYGQWSDWRLYGPILRLARERRLRVVALNAESSVVSAIGKQGLDGIPPWMRMKVPERIDTSNKKHEKSIREFFHVHPGMENAEERFKRFYQAQCTWDETMAESAVEALATARRPGSAIVVLAGSMHVKDFYPIPERARRRNGLDYRTVLPVAREEFPKEGLRTGPGRTADYVFFTGPPPAPAIRRLGVILRGGDSYLKDVWDGPAKTAGLLPGDVLVSVDAVRIRDQVDVRLALETLTPGERIRFTWMRDGKEMRGEANLPMSDAPPAPAAPAAPPAPAPATPEPPK